MFLTAHIRDDKGEAVGVLVLKPKRFRSGKTGWFGVGKIEVDGERCQAQGQVVRITARQNGGNDDETEN